MEPVDQWEMEFDEKLATNKVFLWVVAGLAAGLIWMVAVLAFCI